jgi:NAD(P)-dependent dehydrogenase (short-subunit alcohol dehydrogenase family)
MPSLATVRAANATYAPSYIPTAVFIGGTSGIGQAMAELFAKQTKGRANIIIIGRNKAAAEKIIAGFPKPPTEEGVTIKHEFVPCDVSELKNVHTTSQGLLQSLDKINILVLCTGGLSFNPVETSEGLEFLMVLRYYSRAKFIHELMPLLQKARAKGEDARVMSVLAAAKGGTVDMNDLGLTKKWSFLRMVFHSGTFNDIMVKVRVSPLFNEYSIDWYDFTGSC